MQMCYTLLNNVNKQYIIGRSKLIEYAINNALQSALTHQHPQLNHNNQSNQNNQLSDKVNKNLKNKKTFKDDTEMNDFLNDLVNTKKDD